MSFAEPGALSWNSRSISISLGYRREMKQCVKTSENLLLVSADAHAHDSTTGEKAGALSDSFDSWLNSVAPTPVQLAHPQHQPNLRDPSRRRSLTLAEVTRVNFATVRESTEHRQWPPEVVISFLAADVIKRKQT
jgi:hypothetical protein